MVITVLWISKKYNKNLTHDYLYSKNYFSFTRYSDLKPYDITKLIIVCEIKAECWMLVNSCVAKLFKARFELHVVSSHSLILNHVNVFFGCSKAIFIYIQN